MWAAAMKVHPNLSATSLNISILPLEITLIRKLLTEANPAVSHCSMMAMGYTSVTETGGREQPGKKCWCHRCAVTLYQAGGWN